MQARTDLWLMRQGEQTLFEFYAALEKQVTLCKFTYPPKILSSAFIIGLKDRARIKELIVKAGDKPDELPPDQCLKIAVSASHYVQSSNNAPRAATVNRLRHQCTEITQKKYNKPSSRKSQKQGSQQKFNQFKGEQCSQNQNQGKQLKCYNCGENFNGDYE